jgi:HEPN domain-containing protein
MPDQNTRNDGALRANIEWHIDLIAIQIAHAKKVKGRARSGYYKIATILAASIVEALVHALLIKKL